jgi:hypothetical protein
MKVAILPTPSRGADADLATRMGLYSLVKGNIKKDTGLPGANKHGQQVH